MIQKNCKMLYKVAGISALSMVVFIPLQVLIFSISFPPDTIEGWFQLFQENWLLGLIHLDIIYILDNVLVALLYLGLYFLLREENESVMTIALLLGFLGIAAYFSSNTAFEMLSASQSYAAAATDAERSQLLAVGEMLILTWRGTAFNIYYVLNGITLLMIATVMYRSSLFSKKTAVIGITSGVLMVIPSTAGTIGLIFSLLSLIPWVVFSALTGRKLLQLNKLIQGGDGQ